MLIFQVQDVYHALLRFLGHLEQAFDSSRHFSLQCLLINQLVVPEMLKKELDLPLYFEIDLAHRSFRSRPKALRIEEIVRLQRSVRKFLAWKHIRYMIENTYYVYHNRLYPYKECTFWIRVYK